jgi:predicted anti-sigma-YlaC factor YlaD
VEPLVNTVAWSVELPVVMVNRGVMARKLKGKKPRYVPVTTFVGSAVPVIDHVASVNGVPPRVPVMIPPVAVYVRVDASAADGAASMDANAISPTESVWNEMRIMLVSLGMRRRALPE